MNTLEAYKKYKFIIHRNLNDGYMDSVREIKFSLFRCNTTLVPQVGQTFNWKDKNGKLFTSKVTEVDIVLNELRYIRAQVGETEVVEIPIELYTKALEGMKNSNKKEHIDLLKKSISQYTVYDWFIIRDYNNPTNDDYDNMNGASIVEEISAHSVRPKPDERPEVTK